MGYRDNCIPVYVEASSSTTVINVDLKDNPYVQNVRCIELLEWKITGLTSDPTSTPAYTNDILRLRFDNKTNGTGFSSQTHVRSDALGRDIFNINIEKPQVISVDAGATIVTPGEITQQYHVARPLAYFPMGDGNLGQFSVEVQTASGGKPTFTNVYLWFLLWVDNLKV
jgi:hypothetical protein